MRRSSRGARRGHCANWAICDTSLASLAYLAHLAHLARMARFGESSFLGIAISESLCASPFSPQHPLLCLQSDDLLARNPARVVLIYCTNGDYHCAPGPISTAGEVVWWDSSIRYNDSALGPWRPS